MSLQAVLFSQGVCVVLGRAVHDLAHRCQAHEAAFTGWVEAAVLLDQLSIHTRYPNGLPAPAVLSESVTDSQAHVVQEATERVVGLVETFLHGRTDMLARRAASLAVLVGLIASTRDTRAATGGSGCFCSLLAVERHHHRGRPFV